MLCGEGGEIGRVRAHDPLDHRPPQPVLGAERDPPRHREQPPLHLLAPGGHARGILPVERGKARDRGGPEPDEDRRVIGGVALEIAPQPVRAGRFGQRIGGAGEMIEPDRLIAMRGEGGVDQLIEPEARLDAGQRLFGDQRLMALHPGHMGVAEGGDAVGGEAQHLGESGGEPRLALMGQPIDEVDIDRAHPDPPQRLRRLGGHPVILRPADRLLHVRIEVLHAEARPGGADRGERLDRAAVEAAGVDLEGDLCVGGEAEGAGERLCDAEQGGGGQDGGGAAAPVEMADLEGGGAGGDEADLLDQRLGIGEQGAVGADRGGVAAAIPTELAAERDVDVERGRGSGGEGGERRLRLIRANGLREMGRGRVARIAGQALVETGWIHGVLS